MKISQPGDYVFTFYKDCDTGCIAVAQETVNISDPTPTDTPTNTPTATPTPKGERLPTPDPLHTPAPTQPSYTDSDADYIPDTIECPWMPCRDTDGDGVPDYLDSDSDGDGISDKIEGTDDPDPDGIPNYRDLDSDDDTIPDSIESFGDTDNDGTPNFVDLDSDADGLSDEIEGTGDIDGDGVPNFLDNNANDGPLGDADGDGILNGTEDTDDADGDSIPDPDADGDGIKNKADTDSDGDNIHDIVEGRDDPDLDSIPNYLDLDSDGDTIPDEIEGVPDYLIPNDLVYLPLVLGEGQMIHNLIDAPNECVAGQVAQIGHSYRDDFDWLSGAPSYYYDKDWFTFEAVSGQSYVIETFDLGARTDTVLDLYSPNCQTMLAENDDVVPNEDKRSRIVWVAPTSGTYHVLITQWDYVTHGVETQYTFRISSGAGADMLPIPPAAPGLKPPRPAPPPHSTGSGYTSSGKGTSAVSIPLFVAVSIPVIVLVLKQRRQASRRAPLEPLGS
ncbi:MAG: hypothetical protein JW704_11930 [Anaerolineaceae bacterium]|nr:hypothetical protein [Anaerolineaceae bacterium]